MDSPLYLASRGDEMPDDFDGGGVRTCVILRRDGDVLQLACEPPIRDGDAAHDTVFVSPHHVEGTLPPRSASSVEHVYVFVTAPGSPPAVRPKWWGQVSYDPAAFGPTWREQWERHAAYIRGLVETTGSVDGPYPAFGPPDYVDFEVLVRNLRNFRAWGHMDPEQIALLEAVPGWTWTSGDR